MLHSQWAIVDLPGRCHGLSWRPRWSPPFIGFNSPTIDNHLCQDHHQYSPSIYSPSLIFWTIASHFTNMTSLGKDRALPLLASTVEPLTTIFANIASGDSPSIFNINIRHRNSLSIIAINDFWTIASHFTNMTSLGKDRALPLLASTVQQLTTTFAKIGSGDSPSIFKINIFTINIFSINNQHQYSASIYSPSIFTINIHHQFIHHLWFFEQLPATLPIWIIRASNAFIPHCHP